MSTEDPGIWKQVVDLAWVPVCGGVAVIWSLLTGQIKEVKDTAEAALPEKAFDKYLTDQREYRAHREHLDIRLDQKLDEVHKEIRSLLMEMRKP